MDSHIYFSVKREIQILLSHHNILLEKTEVQHLKKTVEWYLKTQVFLVDAMWLSFFSIPFMLYIILPLQFFLAMCTVNSTLQHNVHVPLHIKPCTFHLPLCTFLCSKCSVHCSLYTFYCVLFTGLCRGVRI